MQGNKSGGVEALRSANEGKAKSESRVIESASGKSKIRLLQLKQQQKVQSRDMQRSVRTRMVTWHFA